MFDSTGLGTFVAQILLIYIVALIALLIASIVVWWKYRSYWPAALFLINIVFIVLLVSFAQGPAIVGILGIFWLVANLTWLVGYIIHRVKIRKKKFSQQGEKMS
jgi:fatty-acid desaturase